jgi:hypothetical protein
VDAIQHLGHLVANLKAQLRDRPKPVDTPCAKASQAIFAERGSEEGSIDYAHQWSAQACFELTQPITARSVNEANNSLLTPLAFGRTIESVPCHVIQIVEQCMPTGGTPVKATAGLGTLALSNRVWADPQRRLSVQ